VSTPSSPDFPARSHIVQETVTSNSRTNVSSIPAAPVETDMNIPIGPSRSTLLAAGKVGVTDDSSSPNQVFSSAALSNHPTMQVLRRATKLLIQILQHFQTKLCAKIFIPLFRMFASTEGGVIVDGNFLWLLFVLGQEERECSTRMA
jgi:hypothetical protein